VLGSEEGPVVRQHLSDSRAVGVEIAVRHRVAPPIRELGTAEAQGKCGYDDADGGSDVEGAGQNIVVAGC